MIQDILDSVQQQQAVEAAPKIVDPIQQTVITALRGYLNSPGVQRSDVREAMKLLNQPMTHSNVKKARQGYEEFQKNRDIGNLLTLLKGLEVAVGSDDSEQSATAALTREDLHLVCFDFV